LERGSKRHAQSVEQDHAPRFAKPRLNQSASPAKVDRDRVRPGGDDSDGRRVSDRMGMGRTDHQRVRHLAGARRRTTGTRERCDGEKRTPAGQPPAVVGILHCHLLRLSAPVTSLTNLSGEPNTVLARLTRMRRLAVIALIALATAGCIGSSSPSTSNGRSNGGIAPAPVKADLTITYLASGCPPISGDCLVQTHSVEKKHLTCAPVGGDAYEDPVAACSALVDLVTKYGADTSHVCDCPLLPGPLPKAVGYYNGKLRTIPLDACSLCGLPGVGGDLKILLPSAG
jgi:hypothetical protein